MASVTRLTPFNPWASTCLVSQNYSFWIQHFGTILSSPKLISCLLWPCGGVQLHLGMSYLCSIYGHMVSQSQKGASLSASAHWLCCYKPESWTVATPHHVKILSCCWILLAPPSFYDCPDVGWALSPRQESRIIGGQGADLRRQRCELGSQLCCQLIVTSGLLFSGGWWWQAYWKGLQSEMLNAMWSIDLRGI